MNGIVYATVLGQSIALVVTHRLNRGNSITLTTRKPTMVQWAALRRVIKFSFSNYLVNLGNLLPRFVTVPLSLEILGEPSSAHLFMVWMIYAFVTGPGTALANSALAESVFAPERERYIIHRALLTGITVTLPISGLAIAFAPLVLSVFGQDYVVGATVLLRTMMISAPLAVVNAMQLANLRKHEYVNQISISALIVLGTFAIPVLLLIRRSGLLSIGLGWLISQIVLAAYFTVAMKAKGKQIPANTEAIAGG
jgi:O-antigen/teichoic acid export membrane protein